MEIGEHLEGLREAMVAFVRYVERAGLRAEVPTAPGWRTRRLISHQGLVHRWAAAQLRGCELDVQRVEAEGMNHAAPLDWLREGSLDLVTMLVSGPADGAPVFLTGGSEPRAFWARRQCHETTMHAVDALGASLGRVPSGADARWISESLALDGIDELLAGLLPCEGSAVRSDEPWRLGVRVGDHGWVVAVGSGAPVTTREDPVDVDVLVEGPAVATYLSLWNRGDEVGSDDPRWRSFRELAAVRWES